MQSVFLSCLLIVFGRIIDVTFGTMRMVLTVKEKTLPAAICGFCEVFIWFVVVRDALNSDVSVYILALSYGLGYALGTVIGSLLSKVLISGRITLEVITSDRSDAIPSAMREAGYELTVINVNESEFGKPKYLIIADVDKKRVRVFEDRVHELDPGAFIMLKESKGFVRGFQGAQR